MECPPSSYSTSIDAPNTQPEYSTDAHPQPQGNQQHFQVSQPSQAHQQLQASQHHTRQQYTFPSQMIVTHGYFTLSEIVLVSADPPNDPSFHVSTHSFWSSRPSVTLHSRASPNSPPLATADNSAFSRSADIRVFSRDTQQTAPVLETKMSHGGLFKGKTQATLDLAGVGNFKWRSEGGFMGINANKILVGPDGRQVFLKYTTHSSLASKKRGTIAFTQGSRERFGGVWEVLAVVSLLVLVDKGRRTRGNGGATVMA